MKRIAILALLASAASAQDYDRYSYPAHTYPQPNEQSSYDAYREQRPSRDVYEPAPRGMYDAPNGGFYSREEPTGRPSYLDRGDLRDPRFSR